MATPEHDKPRRKASAPRAVATDFLPGMVARLRDQLQPFAASEARVMGQALEVEYATFDASFSMFGVILYPDWRRGMGEPVRATRPCGRVVLATWVNSRALARRPFSCKRIPPP